MSGRFKGQFRLSYRRQEPNDGEQKTWFTFEHCPENPLTYIRNEGCIDETWIRPANLFETDLGSVPPYLQGIVTALACPRAYILHDSAFDNHGWWESKDFGNSWEFVHRTEHDANDMLFEMARAEGVDLAKAEAIYIGVDIGGSAYWNGHGDTFPVDQPPPFCQGEEP